ncbi:class I SAM-dependent methyltransferase [Sphingorhabdus sp.]|uniref:class I SAM-dependent methyltransferase n=1 Tax=Sphingorhabdus sp. TaxID=1902408 RepID=UPI0032B7C1CF
MNEAEVRQFWQAHPCGDNLLSRADFAALEEFFSEYDRFKYDLEPHIPACLDQLGLDGQKILEVGLGQGAESEQIVRRGGVWTGLDLTDEAVARVKARLDLRGLGYDAVVRGSITEAPFADNSFDMVFSHGVLHHVPKIEKAQQEIHRILKPGGRLVVMLYAKYSLNYLAAIAIVRRLGLLAMAATGAKGQGIYAQHLENARKMGLFKYLKLQNFIHANTDGPLNPYSKVYSRNLVEKDFPDFAITRTYKRFMHAPPLPVRWMPFEDQLGWHLWVEMVAK